MADATARRARRRRVTDEQAREWGVPTRSSRASGTTSARIGVHFDTWFSERTLHERGDVADVLARRSTSAGVVFERGRRHAGCAPTDFGDQRDRVLVRVRRHAPRISATTSRTTATSSSAAGTHLIDIWGADHHGQVKSLQAGMEALGYPAGRARGAARPAREAGARRREVRLSKRAGNIITLADILDEVDPDVARLTFLLQGIDTHADLRPRRRHRAVDGEPRVLRAVRARPDRVDRPQGRRARASRGGRSTTSISRRSSHERELELLRALAEYPDVRRRGGRAARAAAGHHLGARLRHARSTASTATAGCITDDAALTQARLWLAEACRIGLADALGDPRRARARRDGAPRRRRRRRRVDATDAPFDLTLLPASARVDADGRLSVGGRRPRRARRRVRHAAVRLRRGRAARAGAASTRRASAPATSRTRARRSCASRWRGSSPRRGSTSTSRPAASCTSRCTPASRPSGSCSTATTSRRTSCAPRSTPASAASSSTRSTSSTGSRRSSRDGPAPRRGARARHARRRGAHARVHRDRHRRLEVRVHASPTATRSRPRSRVVDERPRCGFAGFHCHIGSQIFRLDSFARGGRRSMVELARRGRARRPARRSTSSTSAAASASAYLADDPTRRRSRRTPRCCATRTRAACADAGLDPRAAAHGRARPLDRRARRASRSTASARSRTIPGVRTYVAVDGGMSDNPRPVTYGARLRGVPPGPRRRAAPAAS